MAIRFAGPWSATRRAAMDLPPQDRYLNRHFFSTGPVLILEMPFTLKSHEDAPRQVALDAPA